MLCTIAACGERSSMVLAYSSCAGATFHFDASSLLPLAARWLYSLHASTRLDRRRCLTCSWKYARYFVELLLLGVASMTGVIKKIYISEGKHFQVSSLLTSFEYTVQQLSLIHI